MEAPSEVREGDIIFQTSRSSQSIAIQRATNSSYSHMGMILFQNNKPYVFEAASTVRYTPLDKWISRGQGKKYVLKRLKDASTVLSESALRKLKETAKKIEGKPYDLTFEWSDEKIYCSELVWKMYHQTLGIKIGELQLLRTFNLSDPVVKKKLKERYGKSVPLDEPVISPAAIFGSPLLITVVQK
jgi:uncharacterized protein YycO